MSLATPALASIYGVHRRQVIRWRDRGLHVEDPASLLAELAAQDRTGSTFRLLSDPAERERITAAIDALRTPSTI